MATQELEVETSELSDLVDAAEKGDEVVLTRKGEPLARITPFRRGRQAGSARGLFTVPDDFDEPLDDFRDYM
jgi:antitoxin (DNA-binding transcriptional repressor) of toxin-antitoxin stability system